MASNFLERSQRRLIQAYRGVKPAGLIVMKGQIKGSRDGLCLSECEGEIVSSLRNFN